uniref:Uncharacterized protein n=1 Tax=Timema monikensis TaxID=170555 RepID=A0A7R9EDW7_9NEOP|nr:unnamed protein product [Timema monikensis]
MSSREVFAAAIGILRRQKKRKRLIISEACVVGHLQGTLWLCEDQGFSIGGPLAHEVSCEKCATACNARIKELYTGETFTLLSPQDEINVRIVPTDLVECNSFSGKPIYIGGLGEDGLTSILFENDTQEDRSTLQSDLEVADELLLLHVHHAAARNVERIVMASSDTDVFVCALSTFLATYPEFPGLIPVTSRFFCEALGLERGQLILAPPVYGARDERPARPTLRPALMVAPASFSLNCVHKTYQAKPESDYLISHPCVAGYEVGHMPSNEV